MARENQGLQIALIVFVMLTIILGVTTFIFYRQYEEAALKAEKFQRDAATANSTAASVQSENNDLKGLMGFDATMKWDDIKAQHAEDMKTYASSFPEEVQFYHPILAQLAQTVTDKNAELTDLMAENKELKERYEQREEIMAPQIVQHDQARAQAIADKAQAEARARAERERIVKDQESIAARLVNFQKQSRETMTALEGKVTDLKGNLIAAQETLQTKSQQLEAIRKETFTEPDGKISWVDQKQGTVWINLGRADSLARQITFAVYPMDTTNLARGGKKASIEVTKILGDHLAEAKILEDDVSDPIMPGDKIHTPVWSVGEKKHFALAGFFDIDGDDKSDQDTVRELITMNGGVVDCETDLNTGETHGAMTANTRYLVLGKAPDVGIEGAKRDAVREAVKAYSEMRDEADRLGIQTMTLGELLQNMGWKNQTQVVRFGRGSNPNDFTAKSPDGRQKVSTGSVSELFEQRPSPSDRGKPTRKGAY